MHEDWSSQKIKELREWNTEGNKWEGCIRFESLNLRNFSKVIGRHELFSLETLRLRLFGISREPQTSRSHVTTALASGLQFEVHVFTARPRSRGKWLTARFFGILKHHNPTFERLRSRFGDLTTNGKPRFAVSGFTLAVCPYLGLKIRWLNGRLPCLFSFVRSLLF